MTPLFSINYSNLAWTAMFPSSIELFSGSQEKSSGTVSIEKIEIIRQRLLNQTISGISFNEKKVSNIIVGGTCSAMALEFADLYLQIKSSFLQKRAQDDSLEISNFLLEEIKSLSKVFKTSNEEMRIRQAAYDTIEVLPTSENMDVNLSKIQSIVNYHNFKIDFATYEINIEEIKSPDLIPKDLLNLPKGIYLLRIIKPAQNEKLEAYGHSTIFIQDDSIKIFYDPNRGAYNLYGKDISTKFFVIFQTQFFLYQTTRARFYRLCA